VLEAFAKITVALNEAIQPKLIRNIDIHAEIEQFTNRRPVVILEQEIVALQHNQLVRGVDVDLVLNGFFNGSIERGKQYGVSSFSHQAELVS
jgi:hypothetical protein